MIAAAGAVDKWESVVWAGFPSTEGNLVSAFPSVAFPDLSVVMALPLQCAA